MRARDDATLARMRHLYTLSRRELADIVRRQGRIIASQSLDTWARDELVAEILRAEQATS